MGDKDINTAYFLSFCIEQYKIQHQLTGGEVLSLFDRYEVLPYLDENFEALHTQSRQWLMEEIDEYINERRKEQRRYAYEFGNYR